MSEEEIPTRWYLICPHCFEVVTVERPLDIEAAPVTPHCSAGHDLLTFERDTLGVLVGATPD